MDSAAVYVDGSICDGKGGIGIYCATCPNLSLSIACPPYLPKDVNIIELHAIIRAMQLAANQHVTNLHIHTDSEAVLDVIRRPDYETWPSHYSSFRLDFQRAKRAFQSVHFHQVHGCDPNHLRADENAQKAALFQ